MIELNKVTAAIAGVVAVIGAVIVFDERYAHAADLEHYQRKQTTDLRVQLATLRSQGLEDRLFELESKPVKTPQDVALIERFKRQLAEARMSTLRPRE